MPKVTLEFDSIEDSDDIKYALYGWKYALVIDELDQYYRGLYKYSEKGSEIEMAELVRAKIREIMHDNGLMMERKSRKGRNLYKIYVFCNILIYIILKET